MSPALPRTTPVLIGIGQVSDHLDDTGYEALSPADLAARAAEVALEEAGLTGADVEVLATPRQFDESFPGFPATLGRPDSFPRAVANRIGAQAAHCIYALTGGQSPQQLVTELAGEIAAGRRSVALVVSSEAISTVLAASKSPNPPDYSETVARAGDEDRGAGLDGIITRNLAVHGMTDAPTQYALFENARRVKLGLSRAEQAADMGAWFAPFTQVAAANPHAAVRNPSSATQLTTVTEDNRIIADPYPKAVVAREKVNQAAAVLLVSAGIADEYGVPEDRRVYLRGHADLRDREACERHDLASSEPSVRAVELALDMAGTDLDSIGAFDLYSCFPIAVSVVADALGLSPDDPRGLTLTGGLPFFGGPGNGYSLHGIVEAVDRCRREPGLWALVGANGGMLSKYSVGVYTTEPGSWVVGNDKFVQAELDAMPGVVVAEAADGWGTVETWTVKFENGVRRCVVVGRLGDGSRFLANDVAGDDEVAALLLGEGAPGARVYVRSLPEGNRVALDERRLAALLGQAGDPEAATSSTVQVRRDGHVLEITLSGDDERNVLDEKTERALAAALDDFEADQQLWVAILTGSGATRFCTEADSKHPAEMLGRDLRAHGLGGLTSRRLTKPVIAALNGDALDGGFELALACHLVVADDHVRLGLTQVTRGDLPRSGGLARLAATLPERVANRMLLTGHTLDATEAARWGLVNEVAPRGTALTVARRIAAEVVAASPRSVSLSLEVLADVRAGGADAEEVTATAYDRLLVTSDAAEGFLARLTGRDPEWRNR